MVRLGYAVDKASEEKAKGSINSLQSLARTALGAIGVSLSISGLKSLAQAAADVEALSSQFEQVFGSDLVSQANDSLEAIAKDTGMVSGRLKGSFTQIAAFAKTTGLESADALAIASRATAAAADSAAFYDRSIEQVTASLQSFLKGNYANDAALGLSCTEVTRSAAANELYGKSFMELSEAEKQLTLLKMVEDANNASGALGQASRESDTWTNQLGNLNQAILELKQKLGGLFLKQAVQVLKTLASVVERVTRGVQWMSDKLGGAANMLKLIAMVAAPIFFVLKTEAILSFLGRAWVFLKGIHWSTVALIAKIVLLALLVDDFIAFVKGEDSLFGTMLEKAGIDADGIRQKIKDIWEELKSFFVPAWEDFCSVFEDLWDSIKSFWDQYGDDILGALGDAIDFIVDGLSGFVDMITETDGTLGPFGEGLAAVAVVVGTLTAAWFLLNAVMSMNPITLVMLAILALIVVIGYIYNHIDQIKEYISGLWEKISGVFSGLAEWFDSTVIQPIVDFFTGLWENISETFTNIWDTVSGKVTEIKDSIETGFQDAIDWIKSLPEQALQWGKDIIQGIIDGIGEAIGGIGTAVKNIGGVITRHLHFSKPDEGPLKDFDKWMPDMMQLMSEGILQGKDRVTNALRSVTGDMAVIAKADVVSKSSMGVAAGVTNSNRTITQNVNINQEFNGDVAAQRNLSKAANSAADDTTGALARALAFAR